MLTDPLDKCEGLEVTLTWAEDKASGQSLIEVTDHGIVITRDDLQKYFAQLGKSY